MARLHAVPHLGGIDLPSHHDGAHAHAESHGDGGARVPRPGARLRAPSPNGAAARIHITCDVTVLEPSGHPRRGHGEPLCGSEPPAQRPLRPPARPASARSSAGRANLGQSAEVLWLAGHIGLVSHTGRCRRDLRRSSSGPRGRGSGQGGAAHHLGLGTEVGRHPTRRGQRAWPGPDRHHRLYDDEASGRQDPLDERCEATVHVDDRRWHGDRGARDRDPGWWRRAAHAAGRHTARDANPNPSPDPSP